MSLTEKHKEISPLLDDLVQRVLPWKTRLIPYQIFSIRNKNEEIYYEIGEVREVDIQCEYIHNNDVSDTTVATKVLLVSETKTIYC